MNLVDILPPPSEENAALLLHPGDHIGIARIHLSPGQTIRPGGGPVVLSESIPAGHKAALRDIAQGEEVRRYGQVIGRATRAIAPGEWVHTHNLAFDEGSRDYQFPTSDIAPPAPPDDQPLFMGYLRPDGRAGTRNYIAVVAASNCSAHVVDLIARSYLAQTLPSNVAGVASFPHGDGCGHAIGPDTIQLQRTLSGVLDHPNVSAALVVGLGCEVNQVDHYLGVNNPAPDRIFGLTLQQSGGTSATVAQARVLIDRLIARAESEPRVSLPASKLVLGLNCGGSDSFSGITSNPALGVCSDLLARLGATSVLAETPEIFGAEHLLVRRARNRQVADRLIELVEQYKTYLRPFGGSFDDNPSPGNKEGGLSNILEKSLGAAAKSGTSTLNQALDYAERITSPGFVFMNTPGYDPVSLAGLGAGGVNLIAFTTGRGSAIGFPTVPVFKISSNSALFARMGENIDLNAGRIADGLASIPQVGQEIFDALLEVASGRRTASERLGHSEFVPWRIGPIL
jgi:altronate hydrolase